MRTPVTPWLIASALVALLLTSLLTEWRIARLQVEEARLSGSAPAVFVTPRPPNPGRPSTT